MRSGPEIDPEILLPRLRDQNDMMTWRVNDFAVVRLGFV